MIQALKFQFTAKLTGSTTSYRSTLFSLFISTGNTTVASYSVTMHVDILMCYKLYPTTILPEKYRYPQSAPKIAYCSACIFKNINVK